MFTFFLPAVGARNPSDGSLVSQGLGGYYRVSTQSSSNTAYVPWFSIAGSFPNGDEQKTFGFSIRCVR